MNLGDILGRMKAAITPQQLTGQAGPEIVPQSDLPSNHEARRIVDEFMDEVRRERYTDVKNLASFRRILEADPRLQIAIVDRSYEMQAETNHFLVTADLIAALLARNLPFTASEMESVLRHAAAFDTGYKDHPATWDTKLPSLLRQVRRYHAVSGALTAPMLESLTAMQRTNSKRRDTAETRKLAATINELLGEEQAGARPDLGETWADLALSDLKSMEPEARKNWERLLCHAQTADGGKPSHKWSQAAEPLIEALHNDLLAYLPKWFGAVTTPPLETHEHTYMDRTYRSISARLSDRNVSLLKGLAWCCAGRSEPEIARALARLAEGTLRKIPGTGPWAVRAAFAAVWSLGEMESLEAVAALSRLKLKVNHRGTLLQIDKAIETVAKRQGVPRDDLEDLAVPAYGLDASGRRRDEFGDCAAEMAIDSTGSVNLAWFGPGGKPLKAVPSAVKKDHADDLKVLKVDTDSAQKSLAAQRHRIENFLLTERTWKFGQWRERYFDHPILGNIVRRLIWRFDEQENLKVGVWGSEERAFLNADEEIIGELCDDTSVRLWHPINASVEQIERWRGFLETRQIRQPFKQAYREVYLVTDAELRTEVYSNRFASHILKQHQMNTLAIQRGWKNKLRLMVDDEYPPAHLILPKYGLRAEFWVEGAGDEINDTGTYLYLATDQVRFYRIDAAISYAHAGGGGYYSNRPAGPEDPLRVDSIPPLVFSEVMRDVDLFVGVASVGNDPAWADGGPEGRHLAYWHEYAFGELTASAQTRAEVLARLLPRLKIASRCNLDGRFLRVRGDFRTYKIHLGSSNILMEPNDQYLCIVQAPSAAAQATGNVFLPFEGDTRLSVIISKAFLLADDKSIRDQTILRQIKH